MLCCLEYCVAVNPQEECLRKSVACVLPALILVKQLSNLRILPTLCECGFLPQLLPDPDLHNQHCDYFVNQTIPFGVTVLSFKERSISSPSFVMSERPSTDWLNITAPSSHIWHYLTRNAPWNLNFVHCVLLLTLTSIKIPSIHPCESHLLTER